MHGKYAVSTACHTTYLCFCVEPANSTGKILRRWHSLEVKIRPNCLSRSCYAPTEQPERLINRHVSIRIVLALQSPSNHPSPLVSFRSLPLLTILAWCQPGGFSSGQWLEKHLSIVNLPDLSYCARLPNKQQPNTDVTMKIWALGVIKQRIFSIALLICDHEILEISYAQKSHNKSTEIWQLKG